MKNYTLKNFIRILALILTITSVTGLIETRNINASETSSNEITQEDLHKNNLQNPNEVEIIDKTNNDADPVIELAKEDIDLKANIQYDLDTDTMDVKGSYIDENGKSINKKYNVLIDQLENEEYEATFIDKDTGEIIKYNSIEAKSSAWPLIILAAVARYGVKYAVKKYGKKATQNAIKTKSFGKVLPSIANLGANKRKHILASKHNWSKVTKNNWSDVSKVMSHVMRHGKQSRYKKTAYQKTLTMSGRTVVVTYTRKNGKIYVSNGWVK
ncbi:SAR2788 family putative toxin [Mammaliicoccus sciuri]|uniref:SAR2788 family putative toxin n=1 Tax=Mammaliicoccus sciuri TaxID=1296 RepID=UPI000E68FEE2|nr:SAR2788 family putative toxin [Mammaliicoccus sciuri]MRE73122.1 MafB-like protein [Mammaliicoccus sciuri]RIN95171.1 MafB-like protein [Mammaliicoccus sciuri]